MTSQLLRKSNCRRWASRAGPETAENSALLLIEAAGAVVIRIDDHSESGDLASRGAVESISRENPAELSLMTTIHGEPAYKRRRRRQIPRQLPHCLRRELAALHEDRGDLK